jgi:histidine ammonia-lyase
MGGDSRLTLEDVEAVAFGAQPTLAAKARELAQQARTVVERKARADRPVYGVSTGFGALAEIKIPADQITQLQRNLILSHAAGVGKPLSRQETRAMMMLRAQTLAQGFSGARPEIIDVLLALLRAGIHPVVPEKGSVGASGDLAPLAHLALGMIGEGEVEHEGRTVPAKEALARVGILPVQLECKEGLTLVNGTQAMTAVGSLALLNAERLCVLADIAGTMTLEGLSGLPVAFDARIHATRPHPGQAEVAAHLRALCRGSALTTSHKSHKVQDPYSLRCMPQVHGASRDALAYCRRVLETEINSATDNPLVFSHDDDILSGGNFHGQPLALALDFAAIALAEVGNISERRVEQMVNPALSGLPPFLTPQSGIHSGYMIAQVTAASLVNENKVLATPASVDSIPGSAVREDHVSMGMTSARKLREIVENVRAILAVELLCAAQAIDLREPERMSPAIGAAHAAVRRVVPHLEEDRLLSRDLNAVLELVRSDVLLRVVTDVLGL